MSTEEAKEDQLFNFSEEQDDETPCELCTESGEKAAPTIKAKITEKAKTTEKVITTKKTDLTTTKSEKKTTAKKHEGGAHTTKVHKQETTVTDNFLATLAETSATEEKHATSKPGEKTVPLEIKTMAETESTTRKDAGKQTDRMQEKQTKAPKSGYITVTESKEQQNQSKETTEKEENEEESTESETETSLESVNKETTEMAESSKPGEKTVPLEIETLAETESTTTRKHSGKKTDRMQEKQTKTTKSGYITVTASKEQQNQSKETTEKEESEEEGPTESETETSLENVNKETTEMAESSKPGEETVPLEIETLAEKESTTTRKHSGKKTDRMQEKQTKTTKSRYITVTVSKEKQNESKETTEKEESEEEGPTESEIETSLESVNKEITEMPESSQQGESGSGQETVDLEKESKEEQKGKAGGGMSNEEYLYKEVTEKEESATPWQGGNPNKETSDLDKASKKGHKGEAGEEHKLGDHGNKKGKKNHKETAEDHTKTVVFVISDNNEKVNETALEKALSKSMSDVTLLYINLNNLAEGAEGDAESTIAHEESDEEDNEEVASTSCAPNEAAGELKDIASCSKREFSSSSSCLCDVDSYLTWLEKKAKSGGKVNSKDFECGSFIKLEVGLVIGKDTKPTKRKRRSLLYLANLHRNTNFMETDDIENVFGEDYELDGSGKSTFTLPGSTVKIPCHKPDNTNDNAAKFSWEFKKDNTHTGLMPGNDKFLTIHNVEIKNAGNYTCIKTTENGDKERFDHELEVITFPIYKIKMDIFYATNDSCTLKDGDQLYSYLPQPMGALLCGKSGRLCKVDMTVPRCLTRNDEDFFNITVTATLNPVNSVFPEAEDCKCGINCKLKIYSNMVGLVYKNAGKIEKQPVLSIFETTKSYVPKASCEPEEADVITKVPKIITTCSGGFGIEKEKKRVCVLCPRHTYSEEDEAFCNVCPAGQYQPMPGSKSCLVCSSPVDDSMCLRMLYSDTKMFKIYVGVAFGLVLLIILILAYWSIAGRDSSKNATRFEGSLKHRAMSRRDVNVEQSLLEPLLDADDQRRRNTPPKLPPPDF